MINKVNVATVLVRINEKRNDDFVAIFDNGFWNWFLAFHCIMCILVWNIECLKLFTCTALLIIDIHIWLILLSGITKIPSWLLV